jgi:hypothetical protein
VSDGMGWGVWWRRRFVQVMAGGVFDGVAFRVAPGSVLIFTRSLRLRITVGKARRSVSLSGSSSLPANVQRHAVSVAEAGQDAATWLMPFTLVLVHDKTTNNHHN